MDTIQFKHNPITNTTITQCDKIIQAVPDCVKALQGAANRKGRQ